MKTPRVRIFGIIIAVSFVLHVWLMVQNALEYQAHARDAQGVLFTGQIAEATKVAITNRDTITLGMLANQYAQQKNISQVQVLDAQQQPLASVGQVSSRFGKIYRQPVLVDNQIIGYVAVTIHRLNRGDVISSQWLYLLGSFLIHLTILWLYQRVARPEKELLELYLINAQEQAFSSKPINPMHKGEVDPNNVPFAGSGKTYQPQASQAVHDITSIHTKHTYQTVLNIAFYDPFNLLETLTTSLQLAQYQLHQTIVEKAIAALQAQHAHTATFVKTVIPKGFDEQGVQIIIDGRTLDVLEFAVQLAYLYTALSKAVSEHSTAHNGFSLPTHCAIAESTDQDLPPSLLTQKLLVDSAAYRIHLHCQNSFADHLAQSYQLEPQPNRLHTKDCQTQTVEAIIDSTLLGSLTKAKTAVLSEPI